MKKVSRRQFVVACAPEEAFDFLCDLRNEQKWNPDQCELVEKVSEGPIGLGTKYRAKWKGGPEIEVTYVEFDAPRSWRAHSDGSMETNFRCTIEPHPEGAEVVAELELIPHGFFTLLFPIFMVVEWFFEKDISDRIRETVEQHVAEPGLTGPGSARPSRSPEPGEPGPAPPQPEHSPR